MKKLGLSIAIATAFVAAPALALDDYATAQPAFVVPSAMFNATQTTAVGITNHSTVSVAVYWSFHNVNSEHVTDGTICLTAKDFQSFAWNADSAGVGLADVPGYLVFAAGTGNPVADATTGACTSMTGVIDTINPAALISANAFQINTTNKDVAVTPVVPLSAADFRGTAGLSSLGANDLIGAAAAGDFTTAGTLSLRYYRPATGSTTIYIWSANDVKGDYTVNAYDNQQNRKSVQLVLPNKELNLIDPSKIVGMPSSFVDGFIEWTPSRTALPTTNPDAYRGIFSYSVVSDSTFGAVQTLLNASF